MVKSGKGNPNGDYSKAIAARFMMKSAVVDVKSQHLLFVFLTS